MVSSSKEAPESEEGMAKLESYESMVVGGEVEGDLRLRGLDIVSGASAGPLLHSFLFFVASTDGLVA